MLLQAAKGPWYSNSILIYNLVFVKGILVLELLADRGFEIFASGNLEFT